MKNAVLMSVKPQYAEMIFNGDKLIELRRVCPKVSKGDLVFVYVSGPTMALVGGFEVEGVASGPPLTLCRKWHRLSGLSREEFLAYFSGRKSAFGVIIGKVWKLEQAAVLRTLRRRRVGFQPPQSYRYLGDEELRQLIEPSELKRI